MHVMLRVVLLALVLVGTGCMHAVKGGPKSTLDMRFDETGASTRAAQELASVMDEGSTPESRFTQRNRRIGERLMMMDAAYADFVKSLQREQTTANVLTDLADLALGVAGTLTGSAGAKTNYAAASALLSGSNASFNRRVFFERSSTALVSAMDAFRARVRLRILESMKKSVDEYRAEEAYYDLTAYEFAGSLLGAFSYVQSSAEEDKKASEAVIDADVRNIHTLGKTQRASKRCLTLSLGKANTALTEDGMKTVGSKLEPKLDLEGKSALEMARLLQARIRDADAAGIDALQSAFSSAGIYQCEG